MTHSVSYSLRVGAFGLAALTVYLLTAWGGLPREQAFMAGILVLAAVLWVSEAIPLFATSVIVIALQVLFLANPGGWTGFGFTEGEGPSVRNLLNAATDPVLVLFFAGFVMARAAVKEGVDQTLGALLLRPFLRSRSSFLYGILGVTALFSMWMSNTATAAFMLTLVAPLAARLPEEDGYRKALLLAVPFAANIGGLGTPIASPPNAIAIGYLQRAGVPVGFLEWMILAVPLVLVLLVFTGWLLLALTRSGGKRPVNLELASPPLTAKGRVVLWTFAVTVSLWITEGLHGLPSSVVALLPLAILLMTDVINRADVNRLDWDVLLLIGGGLALGYGLQITGLDGRIVTLLPSAEGFGLVLILMTLTLVLSNFLSNTAVANLLLPVGLAAALAVEGELRAVILGIALMASLSMALPISTPPNAMTYATGLVRTPDMAKSGVVIGVVGGVLVALALLISR